VGAEIAAALVAEIRAMGMPAERATNNTKAKVNDLLIRGYLISVNKGSKTKRIAIGLGDGSSELKTAVEGFQTTAKGPRKLGSGELDASGAKTPGRRRDLFRTDGCQRGIPGVTERRGGLFA
jgi:hypothetical protein